MWEGISPYAGGRKDLPYARMVAGRMVRDVGDTMKTA